MVMLALRSYSYYTLLYLHYLYRTVPTLPRKYYPGYSRYYRDRGVLLVGSV